jgi:hypothetical protein
MISAQKWAGRGDLKIHSEWPDETDDALEYGRAASRREHHLVAACLLRAPTDVFTLFAAQERTLGAVDDELRELRTMVMQLQAELSTARAMTRAKEQAEARTDEILHGLLSPLGDFPRGHVDPLDVAFMLSSTDESDDDFG